MAAFNFYDPAPVFFNMLGIEPRVNGELTFFEIGTTTPKDTWSDAGLTTLNSNPVILDGSGRSTTNIFLDGDYDVKISDSGGANPITRSIVSGEVAGQTIPPLETGEFLTNDGSSTLWSPVRQLPDATGSTGQIPVTNGGGANGYTLQNIPTAPTLDVSITANSLRVGDGVSTTKVLNQWGNATAPATGTPTTSFAVVFPITFTGTPVVQVTPTSHSQPGGPCVAELTAVSTTGFTVQFDVAEGNSGNANIVNPVPFGWTAISTKIFP